jgi:hypothetical protein
VDRSCATRRAAPTWRHRAAGERSAHLERLSKNLLAMTKIEGRTFPPADVAKLVNGSASEILHRELVYSGMLPEGASYSSRLLACLEIEPSVTS